ncbi:MAG: hypothetical protein ACN6I4_01875 [bacterium]
MAIIAIGFYGLYNPSAYLFETENWQVQAKGQDIINMLVVVPLLLITAIGVFLKKSKFIWLWAGIIFYILYTFVIYCFNIHFNSYFLLYCLVLSVAFYAFIYLLHHLFTKSDFYIIKSGIVHNTTGIYLLLIGVLFYFLWLSAIVPSILDNEVPKELTETGLFTNPVHVIDLSILLPAFIINGVYLLRKNRNAVLLGIAFFSFTIVMNITIGFLAYYMVAKNVADDNSVLYIMAALTIISSTLLAFMLKSINIENKHVQRN